MFDDANLQRTFNDVYKVLNELNDSVKSPSGLPPSKGEGSSRDIRVYKDSRTGFYVLSANVGGEWVSIGMTKDDNKPFTGFGVTKADFATVKKGTNTGMLAFNRSSGKIEEKEKLELNADDALILSSSTTAKPRIQIINTRPSTGAANAGSFGFSQQPSDGIPSADVSIGQISWAAYIVGGGSSQQTYGNISVTPTDVDPASGLDSKMVFQTRAASALIYNTFEGITNTFGGGTVVCGSNSSKQGILTLWDGSGGDKPAYIKMHSPNGTAHYLFVEDDGTVKLHDSVPTDNTHGDVVGAQT